MPKYIYAQHILCLKLIASFPQFHLTFTEPAHPIGNTFSPLMQLSRHVWSFCSNTHTCVFSPSPFDWLIQIKWHKSISLQASEKSTNDEIDCENVTSDFDSNQSPRRKFSKKGSQSFRLQKSFDREESHQTLYELVEISKSSSTIRSSTITCKFAPCHGHHQFKPMPSVHFSQSQTSISESNSKLRIGSGKRMPIRISSLKRETKAAQTLSMVVGGNFVFKSEFYRNFIINKFSLFQVLSLAGSRSLSIIYSSHFYRRNRLAKIWWPFWHGSAGLAAELIHLFMHFIIMIFESHFGD